MNKSKSGKKVGVLTFHRAENYGSVMQSYALQKYLADKLGIENELIDYVPNNQKDFYKLFVPVTSIRNLIGNILKLSIAKKYQKRRIAFQEFLKNNLAISEKNTFVLEMNSDCQINMQQSLQEVTRYGILSVLIFHGSICWKASVI